MVSRDKMVSPQNGEIRGAAPLATPLFVLEPLKLNKYKKLLRCWGLFETSACDCSVVQKSKTSL